VHASPEGDVLFPTIEQGDWQEVSRETLPQGPKDTVTATFKVLERLKN
jgi:dihydrofolate reductase